MQKMWTAPGSIPKHKVGSGCGRMMTNWLIVTPLPRALLAPKMFYVTVTCYVLYCKIQAPHIFNIRVCCGSHSVRKAR